MSSEWQAIACGDFVALQRGHDLPDQERPGTGPILGSFGVTGIHDTVKSNGQGVTIGRRGASFSVAAYTEKDYPPDVQGAAIALFQLQAEATGDCVLPALLSGRLADRFWETS